MVQRYEQTRKLQWYKRGAAYGAKGQKLAKKMKGDEGWAFTIHPQIPCVYRHFRRKDEGMKGKIAFLF